MAKKADLPARGVKLASDGATIVSSLGSSGKVYDAQLNHKVTPELLPCAGDLRGKRTVARTAVRLASSEAPPVPLAMYSSR